MRTFHPFSSAMLSDTDTHPQHVLSPQHPQVAPSPDPSASLHSILASTKDHDHIHPWSPMTSSANAQQTPPLPIQPNPNPTAASNPNTSADANTASTASASNPNSSKNSKRKLDEPDQDDPHPKIRKTVREHVSQDPARVVPMTTVMCLHAAVAQKSYGSEKRFLCPPPVVHIQGPVWQMRSQQLSMSVVSEQGERSFDQKTSLDNNMTGSFKFLHVTGTAKAKSFQLSLDIADPATTEGGDTTSAGRVWATFDSAPVTIISKPSKKTAKTRNISSCILAGGPVSLFNRINSQTVRTKYMTIDAGQLCASNTSWSAFNVNVVHRPDDAPPHSGPQPVTYGCQVVLSDTMSNIATGPLVIRKVDKGRVSNDDGGPVSQMQKIALQRVNPDGSHHYLSAQGPIPGTPNVVSPSSQGIASQGGTHPLIFQSPRIREETKDDTPVFVDEVDDYLCWTIVGISKFQYTFFDAFGQNNSIPPSPITPFPTLFASPIYRASTNTIEMTVSHFFYEDPKTRTQMPLTVYLGNIGPLHSRVYQAAPPGPLTTVSPYVQPLTGPSPLPVGSDDSTSAGGATSPSGPSAAPRFVAPPLHTIVMVELPPIPDVIKALQEDALPPPGVGPSNGPDISDIQVQPAANGRSSPRGQTEGAEASENPPSHPTPPPPISGRSLPLLFIRASDGVGYHSGRTITCENMFESMDLASMTGGAAPPPPGTGIDTNWLAAAQAAAQADGNMHGWTLRVM